MHRRGVKTGAWDHPHEAEDCSREGIRVPSELHVAQSHERGAVGQLLLTDGKWG